MRQITANERKLIASLQQAKHRRSEGLFVVEGTRAVLDTLHLFSPEMIVATSAWLEANPEALKGFEDKLLTISEHDLHRMSGLKTPQGILAVNRIPSPKQDFEVNPSDLILALDCIQDPGNLGTIIRLADWFGICTILASNNTADCYSPKVVQSTMGALARVEVRYCDLASTLRHISEQCDIKIFGTFLDGDNIYTTPLSKGGIIVMGNEGNGISPEVAACVNSRILIPSYPAERQTVESLNVATATAITLAEFRRPSQSEHPNK